MDKYIISYIEDNELGVYTKRIVLEGDDLFIVAKHCQTHYPTVFEIMKAGELTKEQLDYFTHEAQDQIQRSYREMGIQLGELV